MVLPCYQNEHGRALFGFRDCALSRCIWKEHNLDVCHHCVVIANATYGESMQGFYQIREDLLRVPAASHPRWELSSRNGRTQSRAGIEESPLLPSAGTDLDQF